MIALTIALFFTYLSLSYNIRRRKYDVKILVNRKEIKSYRTNVMPQKGAAIHFTAESKVYYVKHIIISMLDKVETIHIECDDMSDCLTKK